MVTKIYFSDLSGLHPQFLKILHCHEGEMGVLLLTRLIFGSHPMSGADCQEDQSCDQSIGTSSPNP